jgi:hypothetical protein
MKKKYTHKKKRSKQKGGWKWPWETDKVSSKKTKKKKIITPSPLPIDSDREKQLQMWKNSPNMKQKLKEDEFERKAKLKLEELGKQAIPITFRNFDESFDSAKSHGEQMRPVAPEQNFYDDSFDSAKSHGEQMRPVTPEPNFDDDNIDSFGSVKSHGEWGHSEDIVLSRSSEQNISPEQLDVSKTIWYLAGEPREIKMKLEPILCEILPNSLKRLCEYSIYFKYDEGFLKIIKMTDENDVDIIKNNTIISLLRANYMKFNPWSYPASSILEEFYNDMNISFFANSEGSQVVPYTEESIEDNVGISTDMKSFIIQTQELGKGKRFTFILDLTKELENYAGYILKPDITISKCLAIETNNNCINSCEECRSFEY